MNRYSYLLEFAQKARDWDGYMARGNPPGRWFHYREWDGKPYDYRTIAGNELVIDIDAVEWRKVKSVALKIQNALDANKIPYIMAYSGGKGVHFHIFIHAHNFELAIGWKRIKLYLLRYVLSLAGVSSKYIDTGIVCKERQLIRDFGGKKEYFKVPFAILPSSRPTPKKPAYPYKIEVWNVPVKLLQNIHYAELPPEKIEVPPVYRLAEGYGLEYPPYEHARRYYGRTLL